jgi:RNA polymerase primary sigma factor
MIDLNFEFEDAPWLGAIRAMNPGDTLSAARFLTWMEGESEEAVEDALLELEQGRILLDVSDLPGFTGGEAAVRLRREEQLVRQGILHSALEENDPLRLYLEELAAIPVCGDARILAMECAQGREAAREQLLNLSLSRVVETAKSLAGRGVLLLDLIQEGSLGLWQAITDYAGGDFEASSDYCIRQAMAKLITMQARNNGVGQKLRQAMEDYRAVDERLLGELGRNATVAEIAEELHMDEEEALAVRKMLDNARLVSQAKKLPEPEEETEDEERHVEDTALFQARQRILDLLSGLSETDARLLTLRFGLEGGLPLSPEDTGRRLGMTPEEVVAREAAALAQLRRS